MEPTPDTRLQKDLLTPQFTCAALPCDGDMCEPTWSKCAGSAFDKVSPCCGGDVCVMKSIYYSQCRPAGMDVPAGWVGNTMECGAASYGGETGAGSYGN